MWAPMQQQQQQWPHQCCMMRQLQQCRQQHAAAATAACGGSNNSILRQLGQQQWRQLGLQLAQQAALQEQPAAAAHFSHQLQNGMPIWSGLVCCRLPTKAAAAAAALQILPTATAGVWDAKIRIPQSKPVNTPHHIRCCQQGPWCVLSQGRLDTYCTVRPV